MVGLSRHVAGVCASVYNDWLVALLATYSGVPSVSAAYRQGPGLAFLSESMTFFLQDLETCQRKQFLSIFCMPRLGERVIVNSIVGIALHSGSLASESEIQYRDLCWRSSLK